MDRGADRRSMAGCCDEYDHLYLWIADGSRGRVRGKYAGWRKQVEAVLESDISTGNAFCNNQPCLKYQKLPDGI